MPALFSEDILTVMLQFFLKHETGAQDCPPGTNDQKLNNRITVSK